MLTVSTRLIPSDGYLKDGAEEQFRPIHISDGIIRVAIGFFDSGNAAHLRLKGRGTTLTLQIPKPTIALT